MVTLLEMAFAGNCGLDVIIKKDVDPMKFFFNEELGLVLEVTDENVPTVMNALAEYQVAYMRIGTTIDSKKVRIAVQNGQNNEVVLEDDVLNLRDIWNETSYRLELLQANPACVDQEMQDLRTRKGMSFKFSDNW
jgi:phosphoribosylformylglycinamidine synthase